MNSIIISVLYSMYKHRFIQVATNGVSHYTGEWVDLDLEREFIKLTDEHGSILFIDISSITSISISGEDVGK